jgi:hypothetical protein
MSCTDFAVSGLLGVALDGFPIYGPVQYYSEAAGKIYLDPSGCDDCVLTERVSENIS